MDQDPQTQLALLSAKHNCLREQLNEANGKVAELTAEVGQLKDRNKKLQEDAAELKVYKEVIEPCLNRKCKKGEEKLRTTEAKLEETETKLREEQAKVQKLYRRETLKATNQVANVQMSSVKHEAVSVIQHSATAADDTSTQTGPPAGNDADAGPRIASPSVSTSNDVPRPPSGTAPGGPKSEAGQSSAERPDSTQQIANVPVNVTEVASVAGDSENAENEDLLADASRPHSPVLGPPQGTLEVEREEDEDVKRSEVQEELEVNMNTTQELAVSSTTGAQSPATSKKRGRPKGPSVQSSVPRKRKSVEGGSRSSSRVSARSDAQPVGQHAGGSSQHKPAPTSPVRTSIGLTVSPRKNTTLIAQLAHGGRTKKAAARKTAGNAPAMFSSSDLLRYVPAGSEDWEAYHWEGRKCPHANCPGPDGKRLQWVACDRCELFFHCVCVSGKNNAWPTHKSFVCGRCKE